MKVNEKNLPTQQYSPQTDPRISGPHEHSSRPGRDQKTPGQGTQTPERSNTPKASSTLDGESVSYTLPKSARVLVRREFLVLQRKGRRRHTPHFVVITAPRRSGHSRLGITATRRFGNAVQRNWIKRRLREFFRLHRVDITPARDVLVIPRAGAAALSCDQMTRELREALSLTERRAPSPLLFLFACAFCALGGSAFSLLALLSALRPILF